MREAEVLDKARQSGTEVHIQRIAESWDIDPETIFDCWGKAIWSKDFLEHIVKLSTMVGFEQGQNLLLQMSRIRGGSPKWLPSDGMLAVRSLRAVDEPKELSPRAASIGEESKDRNACGTDSGQDMIKGPHTLRDLYVETRDEYQHTETAAPQCVPLTLSSDINAVPPCPPYPPSPPSSTQPYFPVFPPARRTPTISPPTPPSSVSRGAELSCNAPTAERSTELPCLNPLKRKRRETQISQGTKTRQGNEGGQKNEISKGIQDMQNNEERQDSANGRDNEGRGNNKNDRDNPIIVPHGDRLPELPHFLADQAMREAFNSLTQQKWINDDCIIALLEAFNPDPSLWYIASTHLVKQTDNTILSRFKDVGSLPRKLMFPLHLPSTSHWTLAVFDRIDKRCIIYDPKGPSEMAWEMVRRFLKRQNLLPRDATVDIDPFPNVRQHDDINCGVFVIATALHLLQDKAIERVTPGLWRELLASFFSTTGEQPCAWMDSRVAAAEMSTESEKAIRVAMERNLRDVKIMDATSSDFKAYTEEVRLLLAMAESQMKVLETRDQRRSKLVSTCDWFSNMPDFVDGIVRQEIFHQRKDAIKQLIMLPKVPSGGIKQLQTLKDSCARKVDDCDRVASNLKRRRKDSIHVVMASYADIGRRLKRLN
jgi:hypothetical protein